MNNNMMKKGLAGAQFCVRSDKIFHDAISQENAFRKIYVVKYSTGARAEVRVRKTF